MLSYMGYRCHFKLSRVRKIAYDSMTQTQIRHYKGVRRPWVSRQRKRVTGIPNAQNWSRLHYEQIKKVRKEEYQGKHLCVHHIKGLYLRENLAFWTYVQDDLV